MHYTLTAIVCGLVLLIASFPARAIMELVEVVVLKDGGTTELIISGFNLDRARKPKVTLDGTPLPISTATDTVIVVRLDEEPPTGTYELEVRAGLMGSRRDVIEVRLGETSSCGTREPESAPAIQASARRAA